MEQRNVLFIYSFIHPFATCIAVGQVKQSLKHKSNAPSQTIYKTYINSVNKPINMIDQLHKCEYYNRIEIIFLPYSAPPITSII
jgi:hypothetical protein